MSEITIACPHCGIQLTATEEFFGQVTACPGCNQQFQVPAPQPAGPRPPRRPPVRPGMPPTSAHSVQPQTGPQQVVHGGPHGPPPDRRFRVMKTGDWAVVLILMMLPLVGVVMMFVWAFTDGNLNRRNFARAYLIVMGVVFGICLVILLVAGAQIKRVMDRQKMIDQLKGNVPVTAPARP